MTRNSSLPIAAILLGTALAAPASAGSVRSGHFETASYAGASAAQSAVRDARDQASRQIETDRKRISHRHIRRR